MGDPRADTPENRARAAVVAAKLVDIAGQAPDLLILASQFLRSEERLLQARQDLATWAKAAGYKVTSEGSMQEALAEIAPQVSQKGADVALALADVRDAG